jgi:hypothetical protein
MEEIGVTVAAKATLEEVCVWKGGGEGVDSGHGHGWHERERARTIPFPPFVGPSELEGACRLHGGGRVWW